MGREMRPPGRGPGGLFHALLIVGFFLTVIPSTVNTQNNGRGVDNFGNRAYRNDETTVLLVSAEPGKSVPPIGVLEKTARTFVQDGASTEYATQVVGTTLDNGRLYAKILSTSSRVFYEKDMLTPEPASPYLVYPSRAQPQEEWKLFGGVVDDNDDDNDAGKLEEAIIRQESSSSSSSSSSSEPQNQNDRENDIFEVRREFNVDQHQRFKPAKPRVNLSTYTVKQELTGGSNSGIDNAEETDQGDGNRSYRLRAPKIFKPQALRTPVKKEPPTPLATITYRGFAEFTTVVGDTVIVFSPSTVEAPIGRAATTIKGDATLRPADGNVISITPTKVVYEGEKTKDHFLDAVNARSGSSNHPDVLAPSVIEEARESSSKATPSLSVDSETMSPTGLLNVIDSTTSADGTTTHYKSSIFGTYIGTNYARIIHTSSNVYFFPDETSSIEDQTTLEPEQEIDESTSTTFSIDGVLTTPANIPDNDETLSPDDNDLTTLSETTTESMPTFKMENTTPMDPEIVNNILLPEGRSVKGGSSKNNLGNEDKEQPAEFSTRLLPSTAYKTFTYFTTFFVPDGTNRDITTTSIKSREVTSSEVTYLTELVRPSSTIDPQTTNVMTTPIIPSQTISMSSESPRKNVDTKQPVEEDEPTTKREEIELIFKTLYTTYTYLTTFFQESTSSVLSREVVETNVVTQTIGPDGITGDAAGLFDENISITPTKMVEMSVQSSSLPDNRNNEESYTTIEDPITTEPSMTTIQDLDGEEEGEEEEEEEEEASFPFKENSNQFERLEPSTTSSMTTQTPSFETKTYFTTYTYFTTIFVDDETEIETRTEVFSNIVTETLEPTAVATMAPSRSMIISTTPKAEPAVPPEILAYLEAIKKKKSQEEALLFAKKAQTTPSPKLENISKDEDEDDEAAAEIPTTDNVTEKTLVDGEVLGSMVTDVISSSSSSDGPLLEPSMDKRNVGSVPDDQELSESNHHDVEPAPTLLLRTSYTTFTYFTTMYKGDATNVVSRLETVTNVATETIRPTPRVEMSAAVEESSLPVTYFTTFTYWTTFYRAGDTITTSREETVSNIVTPGVSPSPTVQLGVIMTYRPDFPTSIDEKIKEEVDKATSDNEVMQHDRNSLSVTPMPADEGTVLKNRAQQVEQGATTITPDSTTYYTTFTYFTTSYIGNKTILNSRLETITSVASGEILKATGRAIGSPVSKIQNLDTNEKVRTTEIIKPTKMMDEPKTGLLSTVKSSSIFDGTTTHYMTDVFGTYVNGLYAQLVQSSTSLEGPKPTTTEIASSSSKSPTPVLPTGVLSLNKGSIIDADEVTTVYFATSQIGTLIDGLYAKVIESTSSTKIDAEKKKTLEHPEVRHRTGLVRLIKGQIESDGSTIVYQSNVIGTSIDGRYAQIIESTSSYLLASTSIAPTSTVIHGGSTIGLPAPTPAVIQSSIPDGNQDESTEESNIERDEENEEELEEDEEDENGKSKKKSRLTFSSRKRTFTPVIRPFLSRSRPTFNPKRKNAQGATTITRTDITPTITATLAGSKSNRFASSRGRPTSSSTTATANPSRRFSGRRGSSSITPTASLTSSARGRASGKISPSQTFSINRRGPSSIRGSSARPVIRASSSVFPGGASSRFRGGIRSSSIQNPKFASTSINSVQLRNEADQDDEANEFATTTLVTEDNPYTTEDDFDDLEETTTTVPFKTTTESSRRSTNPLLRFRRPQSFTPVSRPPPPPRRSTTTRPSTVSSRASNARSLTAPTSPALTSRSRNTNNNRLFPQRNFISQRNRQQQEEEANNAEKKEEQTETTDLEDEKPVQEIVDNDYEGTETKKRRRVPTSSTESAPTTTAKTIYGNRFVGQRRRFRRQASQLRSYQSNRYRRPGTLLSSAEDRSDIEASSILNDEGLIPKSSSHRYNGRSRSITAPRPASQEKYFGDSGEVKPRTRTRTTPSTRVKPTPTTSARQFTLREKSSPAYKRNNVNQDSLRRTTNSRVRTSARRTTETPFEASRRGGSKTSTRTRTSNRRGSQKGRVGTRDDPIGYYNDGTISVTHWVPTEATIPIINNGVTEQRNIITASPSIEILGPDRYSTVIGGDGRALVVIASESNGINANGQTEVTRFILHSTPTTRVSHTLTTLGGRRVSQSLVVPSTIYSVENVVSTIPASLTGANAPFANILLSQLLLGQLGQQNALLGGAVAGSQMTDVTPTTTYNTRTTSYVTTITKERSTVIPLTFRGKEKLTTLVDSSTDVVTATEFITDTVVVTPTAALPAANLNSLLLLLQQSPQVNQQVQDPLFAAAPIFTQSNSLPGEIERRHQPADLDYRPDDDTSSSNDEFEKSIKVRPQKKETPVESSVITVYVSGKRPGEFSTILSTVRVGNESTARRRRDAYIQVQPSIPPSLVDQPEATRNLSPSEESFNAHAPTQSLESVVGDVGRHISTSIHESIDDPFFGQKYLIGEKFDSINDYNAREYVEGKKRKIVKVRVPSYVSRPPVEHQHKYTVVRRRPLVPYTKTNLPEIVSSEILPTTPRRIVVTRVRSLGARARHFPDDDDHDVGDDDDDDDEYFEVSSSFENTFSRNHKLTVTRTRKLIPTPTLEYTKEPIKTVRPRITRKKLVTVRPLAPTTPEFAIITTGFYGIPSDEHDEEEIEEEEEEELVKEKEGEKEVGAAEEKEEDTSKEETPIVTTSTVPIIITDNFFFPLSEDDGIETDQDIPTTTEPIVEENEEPTTTENPEELVVPKEEIKDNAENTTEKDDQNKQIESGKLDLIESTTTSTTTTTTTTTTKMTQVTMIDLGSPLITQESTLHTTKSVMATSATTNNPPFSDEAQPPKNPVDPSLDNPTEDLSVIPLGIVSVSSSSSPKTDETIPTVIPLDSSMTSENIRPTETQESITDIISAPTREEIEGGLSDELYLSLSRPDLPKILPSNEPINILTDIVDPTPTIIFTETVVNTTRLRTYTYVVTKFNGLETQVTSSTTVRPRVTNLTLTVPVTIVPTSTTSVDLMHQRSAPTSSRWEPNGHALNRRVKMMDEDDEGEGRRLNLATRVMSNGVEVIVAGPTPALRWENSNPQPTLTLSDAVVMLMPQEDLNEFVTKTCTTTFTYLNTITKDGTTIVSTDQQVVANTATEERHRKPGSESAAVTLEASPTLRTEVFKTTYTYLTLNEEHPDKDNALGSSQKVIANTVTAPQHYLDMILEPSEVPPPQTNTYLSTRTVQRTYIEDGETKVETTSDTITRLIITESLPPPPRPTSVATTLTALDHTEDTSMSDISKTYYITYSYYNTYLEKGSSTVVRTNIATSTDIAMEKVPKKTAVVDTQVTPTATSPEPIKIFATKTYLTTFTYFTTLLQTGADGETSTTVSSRSHVVENVLTESIAPSILDAGYMNLLTTAHHSDSVKNVVTGSTIIFFDEEDQIDPSGTDTKIQTTVSVDPFKGTSEHQDSTPVHASHGDSNDEMHDEPDNQTDQSSSSEDSDASASSNQEETSDDNAEINDGTEDRPVGGLLSLGSLGINGLSALGPVITAMAGLLQGKPSTTRRNDTIPSPPSHPHPVPAEAQETTTQRSPIYIPVAEFADGDIETAESQNIVAQLANSNYLPETRHKVAASLVDGIPISPGEIITTNSDVIIGRPGKLGPRPPQTYGQSEQNIGMNPPLISTPNIIVQPNLEIKKDDRAPEPTRLIQQRPPKIPSSSKHDILENDPLLKPPSRPNIEKYANPNINLKEPEWISDRFRRPYNSNDPLLAPPAPPTPSRIDEGPNNYQQETRPWPNRQEESQRPPWAQNNPTIQTANTSFLEASEHTHENQPQHSDGPEPIIHQVPHVIDRSTGQPLLVNIQPSQVANVVIPQGGSQALIFGDTSEPHISGQYFDDPSPYPEPEVGPGSVNNEKHEENPSEYMMPPPSPLNFKPLSQKSQLHTIPTPNSRIYSTFPRPHDKIEIQTNVRPEKSPSDVLIIQRPELLGGSTQGQVHTEILVHQSTDTASIQPHKGQSSPYQPMHLPPRRNYLKPNADQLIPPRRTSDITTPTDISNNDRYNSYTHEKPNRTIVMNESSKQRWKQDRLKPKIPVRMRPPAGRPTRPPHYSHDDRVPEYSGGNKHRYPPHRNPPNKISQVRDQLPQIPMNWHQENVPINLEPNFNRVPENHEQSHQHNLPNGQHGYQNPLIPNQMQPHMIISVGSSQSRPNQNHQQVHQLPPDVEPPRIQSFGQILPRPDDPEVWSSTQTEASPVSYDSEAEESNENVKYHDQFTQENMENESGQQHQSGPSIDVQVPQEDVSLTEKSDIHHEGTVNTPTEKPATANEDENYDYEVAPSQNTAESSGNPVLTPERPFEVYENNPDEDEDEEKKDDDKITEEKPDYEVIQGVPFENNSEGPPEQSDTIDLKPPMNVPHFTSTRPSNPTAQDSQEGPAIRPAYSRPKVQEESNQEVVDSNPPGGHARPSMDRGPTSFGDNKDDENKSHQFVNRRNLTVTRPNINIYTPHSNSNDNNNNNKNRPGPIRKTPAYSVQSPGTRPHSSYPHIITKPRPALPVPITISSGHQSKSKRPTDKEVDHHSPIANARPSINMQPPMIINAKDDNRHRETLETAYQTNFATKEGDLKDIVNNNRQAQSNKQDGQNFNDPKVPSRDMMPPPPMKKLHATEKVENDGGEGDLKPPPISADVLGMSPPPLKVNPTTGEPMIDGETELRPPPPKYIPLKDSNKVIGETPPPPPPPPPPSLPSVNMVPPTISIPTKSRPFLAELLSQDMVPPPLPSPTSIPIIESPRPIELPTVTPAIAVSGLIKIDTGVATDHIPVMQDIESKIPIIHGTVDLPSIMDFSETIKSGGTRKSEQISVYTVRPIDDKTRQNTRVSVQPAAMSTNLIMPTRMIPVEPISVSSTARVPVQPVIRISSYPPRKPAIPAVVLETSRPNISPTTDRNNPTESLNHHYGAHDAAQKPTINPNDVTFTTTRKPSEFMPETRDSKVSKKSKIDATPPRLPPSEIMRNEVTATRMTTKTSIEMKPKAVTHFKTLTVTRTETSVVGSPPTTRTLLLTSTLTSTIVETVTETLLRPTSVLVTSVTTVTLQSTAQLPTYETYPTNNMDSIFVVMSDQNPPAADAEEVEAEYGGEEEAVSRDEQDPAGNEIHRVLSGGILGAPVIPHKTTANKCHPECRSSKSEMCAQVGASGEARCVCRPGFARMFPDRPCKPTYTYTLRVGLERIGRESIKYDSTLNDSRSSAFKRLSGTAKEALDRTLMQSDLRDVYRGLNIVGFHPNPTQVEFHVQLSDNTNETRLKEVLKKYLATSNFSLGGTEVFASTNLDTIDARDFDECSTEENGPHHDCSTHAACFNLRGYFQCSCKEGWADISENPLYPGRLCSQAPLGCAHCNNKGHCAINSYGQEVCECFPWHAGQHCQVNLKVLLIALITTGIVLLGLLGICLAVACFRSPGRSRKSGDRRAMIASGKNGGDTSSEGSIADLAIPHHVPHVLPPPPRSNAPAPPSSKRPPRKATKGYRAPKKPYTGTPVHGNEHVDQERDGLSVMIPRAKYRSGPQSGQHYGKQPMTTFAADEHKLISYLESGPPGNRKNSMASTTKDYVRSYENSGLRIARNAQNSGALVSAGFQVSATVTRHADGDSMLDDTTLEPSTVKTLRSTIDSQDGGSTLARSCGATTMQTTKLSDLNEKHSSSGRSCGDVRSDKQPSPSRGSKDTRDARDSASEGPITAERDLGSTLRLRHTPLYNPDRAASDRDSNFDSL